VKPVHVGCSGWNYDAWRGELYPRELPARRWLERYGERFDTVEVNATFYRLIKREAVARWLEQTPSAFLFAVKASRYLTHVKRLSDIEDGVGRFYERIEPLIEARRLGAVLWQFPEGFKRDERRLAAAFGKLPRGRHAFEFRHVSWFVPEVYAVLRERDAALVIADHPERPFQTQEATASWGYVRLHHGTRGRRGNYSDAELREWSARLHEWRKGRELFVYFNNDWEAFAPRDALRLRSHMRRLAEGDGRRS
jgi:uncharacterized protein YecE (DUF72 family)